MTNEIHGLDEVRAKMRQLANARKIKNACTRSARKAMNEVIKKPVKEKAKTIDDPKSPYKIWKFVATKPAKTRSKNFIVMRVGIRQQELTQEFIKNFKKELDKEIEKARG